MVRCRNAAGDSAGLDTERLARRRGEQGSAAQEPLRVEVLLYASHRIDLFLRVLQLEQLRFALAETVFGGDGAAEFDGVLGELAQQAGCDLNFGLCGGQ